MQGQHEAGNGLDRGQRKRRLHKDVEPGKTKS